VAGVDVVVVTFWSLGNTLLPEPVVTPFVDVLLTAPVDDWTLSLLVPVIWSLADIERWIPAVLLLLFKDSLPESRLLLPNKRPHLLVRIVAGRWLLVVTATTAPTFPLLP
jgi:hypothetical protein